MTKLLILTLLMSFSAVGVAIVYINRNGKKKMNIQGLTSLIHETRMVKIMSLSGLTGCNILAKAEFMSVAGSTKDRVALAIIEEGERLGLLVPNTGSIIFEGTVGSTGISLAMIARAKGYLCHICMPDDVATEKSKLLKVLGATVEKVKACSIIDPNHFVNLAEKRSIQMNERYCRLLNH